MFYIQRVSSGGFGEQFFQLIERLQGEQEINKAIADADPLGMDAIAHELPILNERKDREAIKECLQSIIEEVQNLIKEDFVCASAAIRDICMLAASLVSYGVEPADCISGFSEVLLDLTLYAKSSLPRDSFIDYTARNPEGERERRFTNKAEEGIFIDCLRRGMAALDASLQEMIQAYYYPFAEKRFSEHCYAAAHHFQIMIDAIVQVKRGITPEVFTHSIRPFFEPFNVANKAYSAPSGAEMSILNIDLIIWGADCQDELYVPYIQSNILRLPLIYQDIFQLFVGQKSLITRILEHLTVERHLCNDERNSIYALHHLLTKMYSFRMPHYKVAEENVKLRLKETGGVEVKGSSGFGIDEVKYVLDQTVKCRQILSCILAAESSPLTIM